MVVAEPSVRLRVTCVFKNSPGTLYCARPKPPSEKPILPVRRLPFRLRLLLRVPALASMPSVAPRRLLLLVMMLMMPPEPSASYLAEGEVMTSTVLIWSAGICFSASAMLLAEMVEGLLLMSTLMLLEPRRLTLPSRSTLSSGTRLSTSVASPPRVVWSFSALYTVRSTRSSMMAF